MARKATFQITPANALALAIEVYNSQGFIRSGEGYKSVDLDTGKVLKECKDNKTILIDKINAGHVPNDDLVAEASAIIDKFNGRYMLKKLTSSLTNFEQGVASAFDAKELSNFNIAVIAK